VTHLPALSALIVLAAASASGQLPGDAPGWMARGRAAIAVGQTEKAVEAFGKACSLNPKEPDPCYYLGRTLHALGRYEEARRPLEQALAVVADRTRSRIHRAVALNFAGLVQPDQAETHFLAAVRNFSGEAAEQDPRVDYGAFLVREGRAGEALPLLEKAVKGRPDSSRAHTEMGRALLDTGKPDAAARNLERAVAIDPSAWVARLLLGGAYRQLGRLEESERELTLGRKGWANQNARPGTP